MNPFSRINPKSLICCALLLWAIPRPNCADTIIMKNGSPVEGTILSETNDRYSVRTPSTTLTILKSQVESVERGDNPEAALARAEDLFLDKRYPEAIEAYEQALKDSPDKLHENVQKVRRAWDREIRDSVSLIAENMLQVEANELQDRLTRPALSKVESEMRKRRLAYVLLRLSQTSLNHVDYAKARQQLSAAWNLSPDVADVSRAYLQLLERMNASDDEILSVLGPHLVNNPNDMGAIEVYARLSVDRNPWEALKVFYPQGSLRTDLTEPAKQAIPQILLAAFRANPFPADAPMDRLTLYERYLELDPSGDMLPYLRLKADAGASLYDPLMRYAEQCRQRTRFLSGYWCYRSAMSLASEPQQHTDAANKAATLRNQYVQNAVQDIGGLVARKDFESAHKRAVETLHYFPDAEEVAKLKQEQTSIFDACSVCSWSGKIRCTTCSSKGTVQKKISEKVCPRCGGAKEYASKEAIPILPSDPPFMMVEGRMIPGSPGTPSRTVWYCPTCRGEGTQGTYETVACSVCTGSGAVACHSCGGRGLIRRLSARSDLYAGEDYPEIPSWLKGKLR